jgi:hypothetical protein
MRALLALFILTLCTSLYAMSPQYYSDRKLVEELCSTNTIPKGERIFLCRAGPQKYAAIIRYHQGITIREIIDQTPFKNTTVVVCVVRPKTDPSIISVKPSDSPKFEIEALDMIWLY